MIEEQAPGVRLRFQQQIGAHVDQAPESLRAVDGMFLPHGFLSGIPSIDVFTDDWVLIASRDNDAVGDAVTLDQLAEMPWVVTYHAPTAFTPAVRQLRLIGIEPDLESWSKAFSPFPSWSPEPDGSHCCSGASPPDWPTPPEYESCRAPGTS